MIGLTQKQKLEHFPRIQRERDRLDMILHDTMNDLVTWGKWCSDPDGGRYRAGISRVDVYPIGILIFRTEGQSDSVQNFDWEPTLDRYLKSRVTSEAYQPILDAMHSAFQNAMARCYAA